MSVKDDGNLVPMITCEKILKSPQALRGLLGMSLAEFQRLYTEFELVHAACLRTLEFTRRSRKKRQRAVGAGRKYRYALCDRLVMTLFWLRACTTYKVIGSIYGLDRSTVEDNLKNIMHTLSLLSDFKLERPQAEVPKLRSVQELITAFPDMLLVIDAECHSGKQPEN